MVRYVGKANNVTQRYRAHLNRARKHQIHKKNWIEQLKKEGLKPIIEIIDVVPIDNWIFWETYWISQMRTWGFDLINYTNGGDGCTFGNQTSFKKGDGGKKVIGYDSNYEKIYEFDSTKQADEFLKTQGVWHVCVGKRKTVKKLTWFYEEDIININYDELIILIKKRFTKELKSNSGSFKKGDISKRCVKIKITDLLNNSIKIMNNGTEAGILIGVKQPTISWALTNNKIIKKRFKIEKYYE
jgi:hypothetical protein